MFNQRVEIGDRWHIPFDHYKFTVSMFTIEATTGASTACTKGFFDTEKDMKKVIKSTNYISKLCTLKSRMKFKLF